MITKLSAVIRRYLSLLQEVDDWFAKCSLVAGEQILCSRGCSACCRGLFDITLLDAAVIQQGFNLLPEHKQQAVIQKSMERLADMQQIWPDFSQPWLINGYPKEQWNLAMPEEDETPCPYLADDRTCLIYQHRPMTCRLHGIPTVDLDGEVLSDEWCSLNFAGCNPLENRELRAPFNEIFMQEQLLFREFTRLLLCRSFNEIDTVVPAAVLIDFQNLQPPEKLWIQTSST